jgi:hypothetical protein
VLGSSLGQIADNGCVGVEQVIAGHSRLPGNTGGDEDNLSTRKRSLQVLRSGIVSLNRALGVNVGNIGSNT